MSKAIKPTTDNVYAPPPPQTNFSFPEKDKVQPQGYENMSVGQKVVVIVTGAIKSIGSSWGTDKCFTMDISSCNITTSVEQESLDDAVTAAASKRKKIR